VVKFFRPPRVRHNRNATYDRQDHFNDFEDDGSVLDPGGQSYHEENGHVVYVATSADGVLYNTTVANPNASPGPDGQNNCCAGGTDRPGLSRWSPTTATTTVATTDDNDSSSSKRHVNYD